MRIILIMICFVVSILGYMMDKRIYGPSGILGLFFGTIMFFANLKPYPMNETTDVPYFLITIGVCSYFVGTIVGRLFKKEVVIKNFTQRDFNNASEKTYDIALLVITATFIPYLFNSLRYLLSGHSIGQLYYAFAASRYSQDSTMKLPYLLDLMNEFIGKPLGCALIPLSISLYQLKNKRKYLLAALYVTFLFILVGFQRTYIVYFVLYLVLLYFINRKNTNISYSNIKKWLKENKRKTYFWIFFAVVAFLIISISRIAVYGGSFDLGQIVYYYYCICVNLLDTWFKEAKQNGWIHTYGMFSFRGFFSPFVSMLQLIDFDVPTMDNVDYYMTRISSTVYVTPGKGRNSFVTMFFAFFIDGGMPALILLSFVLGIIAYKIYYEMKIQYSLYSITRYMLFYVIVLLFSMTNSAFLQISVFWSFVILKYFFVPIREKSDE